MDIRSVCICDHSVNSFWQAALNRTPVVKALPILSVVQSVRGSYRVALGEEPYRETGDMGVFVAPRQVTQTIYHLPAADGTMDAHWVFLDVEINRLYKLDDLYTFPTILPPAYNREIFDLITALRETDSLFGRLPALHRLVEILMENASPKPRTSDAVIRLRSYVENHYMHPITPEDLMRVLHCSRSALYRHFREELGESPTHYINRVRIRRAQFLLATTARPISDIAIAVGIPDIFYFSRLFRAISGESARDYRERVSGSDVPVV